MKVVSWSIFGVLSNGLKDNVALQVHVAADGEMELVSDKHLVFDSEGDTADCRTAESDCRIGYSWKGPGYEETKEVDVYSKYDGSMGEEYNQDDQSDQQALALALEYCQKLCTGNCISFYFLKNGAEEETCKFYAKDNNGVAYIEPTGHMAGLLPTDTSKWDLCIWQPENKFVVGKGLQLCNPKVSMTPAEKAEDARKAAKWHEDKAARKKEAREKAAKEKADEAYRVKWQGEVGERIQFKNKVQGRCLAASGGRDSKLVFTNCSEKSEDSLWIKRKDGSYESVTNRGLCARQGDGVRCSREFAVLGDCPGFIMATRFGLVLKMEDDGICLGTWTHDTYKPDPGYKHGVWTGVAVTEEFKDNVMFHYCDLSGQKWERGPAVRQDEITTTSTTEDDFVESGDAGSGDAGLGTNYVDGTTNTLCAQGHAIDSTVSCEEAAAALGYGSDVQARSKGYGVKNPSGCFLRGGKVFFNILAGGSAHKKATPICVQQTS